MCKWGRGVNAVPKKMRPRGGGEGVSGTYTLPTQNVPSSCAFWKPQDRCHSKRMVGGGVSQARTENWVPWASLQACTFTGSFVLTPTKAAQANVFTFCVGLQSAMFQRPPPGKFWPRVQAPTVPLHFWVLVASGRPWSPGGGVFWVRKKSKWLCNRKWTNLQTMCPQIIAIDQTCSNRFTQNQQ